MQPNAFGTIRPTQLRVRLADRGLLATNDVLAVVARVIARSASDATVSDLLT